MATTPEGKVKKEVKKILDPLQPQLWYTMPVPTGRGKKTIDFLGTYYGLSFGIETKAPGEEPTEEQNNNLRIMQQAGTQVFCIDGGDKYPYRLLQSWLSQVHSIHRSLPQFPIAYRPRPVKLIELVG